MQTKITSLKSEKIALENQIKRQERYIWDCEDKAIIISFMVKMNLADAKTRLVEVNELLENMEVGL